MGKKIVFCFIFLIFAMNIVTASKLEINYINSTKAIVVLKNCSEPGLGYYYLVFSYTPKNARILEVRPRFISDYNIINNTILIAGIQGKIPGPIGDLELVEITSDRKIELSPIIVIIKDVRGNTIYASPPKQRSNQIGTAQITINNNNTAHLISTPSVTSVTVQTQILGQTPIPTQNLTPAPTSNKTEGTTETELVKKKQNFTLPENTILTPSEKYLEYHTFKHTQGFRKIPVGNESFIIAGLIIVTYILYRNR